MIGQTITHYKIIEELGRGGMGVVYKAEDTRLMRTVALKFLPSELTRDEAAKQRFIQEAQTASSLDHPNICTVYEIGETEPDSGEPADGQMFIAMACYEGDTLKKKIDQGPLKIQEAVDIAAHIARGLQAAHEKGIVHRDVKSANIMVTVSGQVKIMDFGLAKMTDRTRLTKDGITAGTIAYMSPEQGRGEDVDHRTDIWSLGVVLYEMLTGRLPFKSEYEQAMVYAILNESPPPVSALRAGIPKELEHLVNKCLEKDREARPQSMAEVLELLGGRRFSARSLRHFWPQRSRMKRLSVLFSGLTLSAVLAWTLLSHVLGPEMPGSSKPETRKLRLGILPFQNPTDSAELAEWPMLVQTLIVGELTGIERIGVVDPHRLNSLLENSFGTSNPRRGAGLYRLLKDEQIDYFVDLSIFNSRIGHQIQADVVETSNEEVRYTSMAAALGEEGLQRAVSQISKQILDFLYVEVLHSNRDLKPWISRHSPNLEAVKAFMQASDQIYHLQDASKSLQRAIDLDSTFVSPRIWLIPSLVVHGNVREAKQHYQTLSRMAALANNFEQAMISWTDAYLSNDNHGQSRCLKKALEFAPGNSILLYNLACIQYDLGDFDSALEALLPLIKSRWPFPPLYSLSGQCYIRERDFDKAMAVLSDAPSPVYYEVYGMLAALHLLEKDTSEARRFETLFINRSKELGYDKAGRMYFELGGCLADVGLNDRAAEMLGKALAVDSSLPEYHDKLGEVLYRRGELQEAVREYFAALRLDSTWSNGHLMLGKVCEQNGNRDEAVIHYRSFLALDSTSDIAQTTRLRLKVLQR